MSNVEGDSSDAPEEFTADQGAEKDQEIRRIQRDNRSRVTREAKERRRLWAQRKTKRPPENSAKSKEKTEPPETENQDDESMSLARKGMLPNEVVNFLATRERRVFLRDSEEERPEVKPTRSKRKAKGSGSGTVVLSDIPPPSCAQNSLEFLTEENASSEVIDCLEQLKSGSSLTFCFWRVTLIGIFVSLYHVAMELEVLDFGEL